jgi:hypothetical protein
MARRIGQNTPVLRTRGREKSPLTMINVTPLEMA